MIALTYSSSHDVITEECHYVVNFAMVLWCLEQGAIIKQFIEPLCYSERINPPLELFSGCHSLLCDSTDVTALRRINTVINMLGFQDICKPTSWLYHLIPPQRDSSVTTRLRDTTAFPKAILHTKKNTSFINFGLYHYQSTKWILAISLHIYLPQHMYVCISFVSHCLLLSFYLLFQLYVTSIRPSGHKDANKLIDWLIDAACDCVCPVYCCDAERPLMMWPDATESGRPVTVVRWCRSRPSVFFVVDSDSCLYIWDLHMEESSALKRERITQQSRSRTVLSLYCTMCIIVC